MAAKKQQKKSTVDRAEVSQFTGLADRWWDETGPFKPLHRLNPVRLAYIRDQVCAILKRDSLKGVSILDVGCGGGIVSEPLARLGAKVTGLDAGAENIAAAKIHARESGLEIDYVCTTAEDLCAKGKKFDVVIALEIVEHVADPALFLSSCAGMIKPDGVMVLSTLNRTAKSFALGIVAAEYILRWLPAGTHDWKKFMKPSEIAALLEPQGLAVRDVTGLVYDPFSGEFSLNPRDLAVNYLMTLS